MQKKQIPPVHDPGRTTTEQAAQRAQRKRSYAGMTPEAIIRDTPDRELARYARRGAPLAIAEKERRMNGAMAMHSPADMILPDPELDIGV